MILIHINPKCIIDRLEGSSTNMTEQYINQWKRNTEAQLRRRQNLTYRTQEQVTDMERRQIAFMNPENRAQAQVANTAQR
jgi:hypothetical protein